MKRIHSTILGKGGVCMVCRQGFQNDKGREERMAREQDGEQVHDGEANVGFVGIEWYRDTLPTTAKLSA